MIKLGKINIVGIEYDLFLYENEFEQLNKDSRERDERYNIKKEDPTQNIDGYCDYSSKEIRVFIDKYTSKDYFEMTLRHEITHAFLYEIGNTNCNNEEFVDKISKWVPQIHSMTNQGMGMIRHARSKKEQRSEKTDQQSIPRSE